MYSLLFSFFYHIIKERCDSMGQEKLANGVTWVYLTDYSPADLDTVRIQYDLSSHLMDIISNSRPRVDILRDKDNNAALITFDVAENSRFSGDVIVEPIHILIQDKLIVTFTQGETNYVNGTMVDVIADLSEDSKSHLEPIDLALKLIFELTDLYFDKVEGMNAVRTKIQTQIGKDNDKKAIKRLMEIQTNLVFFMTALTANSNLLEAWQHEYDHVLDAHQMEILQDDMMQARQAIERSNTANSAATMVSNAISNMLDDRTNRIMKFLTIVSMLLSIPTIVFSALGQNVLLPSGMNLADTVYISGMLLFITTCLIYLYLKWGNK